MNSVVLSTKFQITIPKVIRMQMDLKAGTAMNIIPYGDRLEFIPVRPMKLMRGFIKKKFDTTVLREYERSLILQNAQ